MTLDELELLFTENEQHSFFKSIRLELVTTDIYKTWKNRHVENALKKEVHGHRLEYFQMLIVQSEVQERLEEAKETREMIQKNVRARLDSLYDQAAGLLK